MINFCSFRVFRLSRQSIRSKPNTKYRARLHPTDRADSHTKVHRVKKANSIVHVFPQNIFPVRFIWFNCQWMCFAHLRHYTFSRSVTANDLFLLFLQTRIARTCFLPHQTNKSLLCSMCSKWKRIMQMRPVVLTGEFLFRSLNPNNYICRKWF